MKNPLDKLRLQNQLNKRSKLSPQNREDAYCYQLEDDLKVLQALSLVGDKKSISKQADVMIQRLEQLKLNF